MKKALKFIFPLLIIGSLLALWYVYANITSNNESAQTEETSEETRQRNLDWLEDIYGYSENDETDEEDQAMSTEEEDETATSTEEGRDTDNAPDDQETADTSDETTDDETTERTQDEDRIRGVENLGKADALESTVYDHAFDKLILFAELGDDNVSLEWTPTESASFDEYKIVRSTTDENPYYPKTTAIKTISNIDRNAFTDKNVESGTDYYYRVCFTKTSGRPGCGNILKVTF